MKLRRIFVLLFASALVASACSGSVSIETSDPESPSTDTSNLGLVTDDTLTVCTDVPYPPMEFEDPDAEGGYTGFDIEIARAIAKDLGLTLAVATPGWDAITSGLAMEAGDCDISAASITITPEREEAIDFTEPYFDAEQSLLVADDSDASSIADVSKVAVQTGTTGEIFLNDSGFDGVEVISYEGIGDLYLALDAGDVDGVMTDLVGNQGYVDENNSGKVIESFATDEVYGMAVKEEGSEELLKAVNDSLAKLRDDGTYDSIFNDWFSG